jgi:hypothetical protein
MIVPVSDETAAVEIPVDDPRAVELVLAVHSGDIDAAFWQACHGGQRRMAEYLLAQGADINASPDYAHEQTALEVAGSADTQRQILVDWLRERGAAQA